MPNSTIEDTGRANLSAKCLQSDLVQKCYPPLEHWVHVAGTEGIFALLTGLACWQSALTFERPQVDQGLSSTFLGMAQVRRYGLQRDGCEWWAADVDVLPYALVVDWVLSDSAMAAWDNNGQQVCLDRRTAFGFQRANQDP